MASKATIAPIFLRFKAFVIDIFLIAVPLLYITTYLILNGKDDFQKNQIAIAAIWLIYAVITSLFYAKSAQTPGYRSQQIYLINLKTGKKVTFFQAFIRFLCFLLAGFCVAGLCFCFFRKDRLNLHDLLTKSAPVIKKL